MDDYRKHLVELNALVKTCAAIRDLKNCDPLLVGPDDRVPVTAAANSERRLIRYGWLRVLFSKAEEPDVAPSSTESAKESRSDAESGQPASPTTSKLLLVAEQRLDADLTQANAPATVSPDYAAQRAVLAQVLAERDFRDLAQPTVKDSVMEKVNNWLNHVLANVIRWRARSAWVGRLLVWGFIISVSVALLWFLLRLERRWRVHLVPEQRTPVPTSPSARNWQLWLEDARRAAAAGQWREAIHFVYWASIARLEAKRLWPADRARTPREYLSLLPSDDPRRPNLVALTGSFEHTWYGGRAAGESDYRCAEEIATALMEGGKG